MDLRIRKKHKTGKQDDRIYENENETMTCVQNFGCDGMEQTMGQTHVFG